MVEAKAICCLIGAVLINITLGTLYSIGNLNPYIASYMRAKVDNSITKEDGIWITSTFLLGQGIFLILGAHIERRHGVRVACIVGCVIHTMSCFCAALAINVSYLFMILVYGFGTGCGAGSAYMATIVATQRWFPLNKGLFTGVILAGFGFGGLIYTNLQTWFINPANKSTERSGYFQADVYESLPGLFVFMGSTFVVLQTIGCALAFPPPPLDSGSNINNPNSSNASSTSQNSNNNNNNSSKQVPSADNSSQMMMQAQADAGQHLVLPQIRRTSDLFKTRIFYVIGIMMALVVPGMTFVNSMGKSFGQIFIEDDRYLAVVTASAAIFNSCGRLFWGYLMDRLRFSTCLMLKCALFIMLIVTFPFEYILKSKLLYTVWMLGLFFNFAGIFVVFPVFIDQVFGARFSGMAYGFLYNFLSISSILSSFIMPWMMKKSTSATRPDYDPKMEPVTSRLIPPLAIAFMYACCVILYYLSVPVRRLEQCIDKMKQMEVDRANNNNNNNNSRQHYSAKDKSLRMSPSATGGAANMKSQSNRSNAAKQHPPPVVNPVKSRSKSKGLSAGGKDAAQRPPTIIEDHKKTMQQIANQALMIKTPASTKSVIPATAATKSELSSLEGKNSLGTLVYLNQPNQRQEIKKLPAS